jgi:hypothetical protein
LCRVWRSIAEICPKFRWRENPSPVRWFRGPPGRLRRLRTALPQIRSATTPTCFARHLAASPPGFPRRRELEVPHACVRSRCARSCARPHVVRLIRVVRPDKPFKRDELADAAIKLEAQIKSEAGPATRPAAALRREADAAFQRNDFRNGMKILQQIVAVAPDDSTSWLRLAKAVLQSRPANDREKVELAERAAAAGYIAYQRSTGNAAEEAESLTVISRSYADRSVWRPALDALRISLDLREVADVRQQYERMREDHGFRLLDYSVDSDASSPRACFQFSEDLPGRRTDLSPFVAVSGQDRPALSVDARQICVEGLKHGERYSITLRAGIRPPSVKRWRSRAEFNIYVRDRKPLVRFSGRAYVLPRAGQRGIPVVSVNTSAVAVEVYRIGDRNLVSTVLGHDFQRTLNRYELTRLRRSAARRSGKAR